MAMLGGGALVVVVLIVAAVMMTRGGDGGGHGGKGKGKGRRRGKWKNVDCNACPADVDPTWQPCGFANGCQARCAPGDRASKRAAFQCHRGLSGKGGPPRA